MAGQHRRIYSATQRLAGGGRVAVAKCACGWSAQWCRTQQQAAEAYGAHARAELRKTTDERS